MLSMADEPQLFAERDEAPAGSDASGHRARLRKRLLEGGAEALADHEVIEYLLMTAIPRRDVKPLARTLIGRFGSLAGVLNADARALANHPGMGETSAAALKIVALASRRLAREQVRECLDDEEIVVRYGCAACRWHQTRHYHQSEIEEGVSGAE